jgi:hypothetical protein
MAMLALYGIMDVVTRMIIGTHYAKGTKNVV